MPFVDWQLNAEQSLGDNPVKHSFVVFEEIIQTAKISKIVPVQTEKVGIVVVALEEMGFEDYCYQYFFAGGNELHLNLLFFEDQVKIFHSFDVLRSQIFEYLF